MTDWQEAVNLMVPNGKKIKSKKSRKFNSPRVGLRCWECGLYIDNLHSGHYCTRCLMKQLKKYVQLPTNDNAHKTKDNQESGQKVNENGESGGN